MSDATERQTLLPSSDTRHPLSQPPLTRSGSSATLIASNYGAVDRDTDSQPPKPKPEQELHHKQFHEIWALFMGLAFAVFCSALGATIVANLTIEIGSYFHAGSLSSWLGTAFLLGLTAMTPLYGRLAQVMGRKGCMLLALTFFLSKSLSTLVFMLFARGVAGAGSGGILTVTAIIISDLVSLADRGLYQGGINLLFGGGSASGAILGGYIYDKFGWRAAFWVQVPPVLFSFVMVIWKVDVGREEGEDAGGKTAWEKVKGIDWLGSFVLMMGISSFSIFSSLFTSSQYPFLHPLPLSLLITSIVACPVFYVVEKRAHQPILPLTLLTRAQPSIVLAGFVSTTATNFSRLYMQPVYLHVVRGLNGSETGLLLIPSSIAGSFSSLYAGWHMKHWKEYKWFQVCTSLIPWLQALSIMIGWGPETSATRLWSEMALGSLGGGATITTLLIVGVAISSAIQQSILISSLSSRFPSNPDLVRKLIQEPAEIMPLLGVEDAWEARLAYLDSIRGVFGFVVIGGIALTGVCIMIRGRKL
ncbi:hypothetical protein L198_01280 [Cryptococcus wingfieldii CBS 7118]|uniref:Major facilitator superfamily (MFS) profile domain-containing protein n=1 Tax=Cryptococcus wingfieldii CBS 7118 TaxID=1295528 RepID=A0A1E3JZ26_9TREE|nr:hypothetical protein L198_01280 [Cryptococcus wingfieldii CBS 7118]ODO06051.1 hypothetical protein L198_01280 [Cryptococcus wingfieldii CBS 7118]